MKRAILLAALLFLAACNLLREPTPLELTDEQIMVHGMLEAGSDSVAVLLTRVRPGRASGGDPQILPVSGAEVQISGGGHTVRLTQASAGNGPCFQGRDRQTGELRTLDAGCYTASLPGGVRAGMRYDLFAQFPGGEIRGSAEIPEPLVVLAPVPDVRLSFPERTVLNFTVRWRTPAETAGVGIAARADAVFRNGARVANAQCFLRLIRSDRSVFDEVITTERGDSLRLEMDVDCQERRSPTDLRYLEPDSVHARLLVTAYDSAYARYAEMVRGGSSVQRSRFAAGVTNALGVFAGATTTERRITLVRGRL